MALRPLVVGNWKMNGKRAALAEIAAMAAAYDAQLRRRVDLVVCPPATLTFTAAATVLGSRIAIGGQDCHACEQGAFTGCLSAAMLADAGALYVIVGHSERRRYDHEDDAAVRSKAQAAARAGLTPIICIGETLDERDAGKTLETLAAQVAGSAPDGGDFVIAYEPVWAIGAGRTPDREDVAAAHALIRTQLDRKAPGRGARTRILYGGSVAPANAAELLSAAGVDGALVGGASLRAGDFMAIAEVYRNPQPV